MMYMWHICVGPLLLTPTIALLSTHMHSMLMAIHAFTFPSFPTQSKRWTSSSLRSHESPTSEAFEWQGDSRQVLHAYQMSGVACPAICFRCQPTLHLSPELGDRMPWPYGYMWLPYHVMTRAHGSTFLTTPSLSPNSL